MSCIFTFERQVRVGVSDEQLREINEKAQAEKQILMKQAQDDMKQLIDQQSRTAHERQELQAALDREAGMSANGCCLTATNTSP